MSAARCKNVGDMKPSAFGVTLHSIRGGSSAWDRGLLAPNLEPWKSRANVAMAGDLGLVALIVIFKASNLKDKKFRILFNSRMGLCEVQT